MRTFESKRVAGLFMTGELLNVDGVTGGFNFMNCWCSGFAAGANAAGGAQGRLGLCSKGGTAPATVAVGCGGRGGWTAGREASKDASGSASSTSVPR